MTKAGTYPKLAGLNNILFGNRNTYTKIYIVL